MAEKWNLYNPARRCVHGGLWNLESDDFRVILVTADYQPAAAHKTLADVRGEVKAGNGYEAGGQKLTGLKFTNDESVTSWGFDNPTWRAVDGRIGPFRTAVVYNNSTPDKQLVAWSVLDKDDLFVIANNSFVIEMHPAGLFVVKNAN